MSRFVIVDPFISVRPVGGRGSQLSVSQVETYLQLLANQPGTRRYASLAFNHFTCGRYDQTNAALAKLGIVFYRVGGAVEKRRGTSGYQIRKSPNRTGTRSEHSMGSYWEPEPAVKIPSTITPKPRKRWWRFW